MKTTWTAGLSPDRIKEVRAEFKSSPALRERLEQMLSDKIGTARRYARSNKHFDDSNWDRRVAHGLGYEAALSEIIALIKE